MIRIPATHFHRPRQGFSLIVDLLVAALALLVLVLLDTLTDSTLQTTLLRNRTPFRPFPRTRHLYRQREDAPHAMDEIPRIKRMQSRLPHRQRSFLVDTRPILRRAESVPESSREKHHLHACQYGWDAVEDVVVAESRADFDRVVLEKQAEDPGLHEPDEDDAFEAEQLGESAAHFHEVLKAIAKL